MSSEARENNKRLESSAKNPIVKKRQIAEELSVDKSTVSRWWKSGYLPKPVRLGTGSNAIQGLPRSVLDAWKVEQGWPAADEGMNQESAA